MSNEVVIAKHNIDQEPNTPTSPSKIVRNLSVADVVKKDNLINTSKKIKTKLQRSFRTEIDITQSIGKR